ncbi:MAG: preprotein translocase subunit SecY [Candidatus Vogelbacteria bacterium GWA1_51_14]|uniref:Protein translocase subunit SecY n=1 Tax=Candidatus Vogelbacteria bacterium GWA1_51_14 TaxID=1802435 RepID=A0A1G2Q8G4_9BACT|nr:MAG: preprotein translocase subunit SecY [Candidatus Vogelbacteria bacterium GWA1_51_14]
MFNTFVTKLKLTFEDRGLRRRILFVILILALFRLGTSIFIPGVDRVALEQFFSDNQFFGLLNIFSGGGLSNLSIMMLGAGPFITASIIMQLLTLIFPSLKELYHEEGAAGRRKMAQYSRLLTVPLALIQGFSLLVLLERQGVLLPLTAFDKLAALVVVTAGAVLLMWLGEMISEYGIGNGISLLIFAGILAGLPSTITQLLINFDPGLFPTIVAFLVAAVAIVAAVVVVTEGERPIPITYAKRVRGMKVYGGISTYLPIRVNNAGVMPIIFALSILLFPQLIANFLGAINNSIAATAAEWLFAFLNNGWAYSITYFVLVFAFTFFYSAITFDPHAISENLQKSGAFIPGIRPGAQTSDFLAKVLTRLTLVGALFLGVIAMLPLAMQEITGIASLAIGGTSLLIVVSVALDFMKQVDAQLSMREY